MLVSFTSGVQVNTIEEFDAREAEMLSGYEIESMSLVLAAVAGCKWRVKLAIKAPDKSYLCVGLRMDIVSSDFRFHRTEQVMFDFCALDAHDKKHYNFKDRSNVFIMKSEDKPVWKPFLPVTEVASLVSNNELKVRCKIHVLNREEAWRIQLLPPEGYEPLLPPKLGSDLKAVLENGSLSDVSLVVGDRTIPAHRVVLASRSSVFRAMFEHNMKESGEGRVDISDCSYEAVAAMLKFMYCDIPPEFDDDVSPNELLMVADKYDVPGLKRVCEDQLLAKLNVKTAAHTLQLADCHSAPFLKHCTLAFISVNLRKVMATDEWREITRSRPDFLGVVLDSAAECIARQNNELFD